MKNFIRFLLIVILLVTFTSCGRMSGSIQSNPADFINGKEIYFIPVVGFYAYEPDDNVEVYIYFFSNLDSKKIKQFNIISDEIIVSNYSLNISRSNIYETQYNEYQCRLTVQLPKPGNYSFTQIGCIVNDNYEEYNIGNSLIYIVENEKIVSDLSLGYYTIASNAINRYSAELVNHGENIMIKDILIGDVARYFSYEIKTSTDFFDYAQTDEFIINCNEKRAIVLNFTELKDEIAFVALRPAAELDRAGQKIIFPLGLELYAPEIPYEVFTAMLEG